MSRHWWRARARKTSKRISMSLAPVPAAACRGLSSRLFFDLLLSFLFAIRTISIDFLRHFHVIDLAISLLKFVVKKNMALPRIELGLHRSQRYVLPLDYRALFLFNLSNF